MTEHDQIQQFADELDALINRQREEYDLCYAAVIGALQMKIHLLCVESEQRADEV